MNFKISHNLVRLWQEFSADDHA